MSATGEQIRRRVADHLRAIYFHGGKRRSRDERRELAGQSWNLSEQLGPCLVLTPREAKIVAELALIIGADSSHGNRREDGWCDGSGWHCDWCDLIEDAARLGLLDRLKEAADG